MALDVGAYNKKFMDTIKLMNMPFNNAEQKYGVEIQALTAAERGNAQQYWRVIGVHHLTGRENMGNHHVYCDVLDEQGNRLNGARLALTEEGSTPLYATIDKPANEAGTNFPMWKTTKARVKVDWPAQSLPSETVTGLRIDHPDEEVGNTWGHHSFYVVFQRSTIDGSTPPPDDDDDADVSDPIDTSGSETLAQAIAAAGQSLIIPLNPEAMFYKFAKQNNLGERLSREYDVAFGGKSYRAQVYEKGIVYAAVGDWGNVHIIPREN